MSQSLARLHYPYLVYRGDKKMLWDPVRRQSLKIQPEERVRQRLLNCFMYESLYPKSRISTEAAVHLSTEDTAHRTDIICYDTDFTPALLVECKAEHIPLSKKAARQIALYNREVKAPLILLSNGHTDRWYDLQSNQAVSLEEPPSSFALETFRSKDTGYWVDRGFIGKQSPPKLQEILAPVIDHFWIHNEESTPSITFLSFNQHPEHLFLDHYYYVEKIEEQPRIRTALAFSASQKNATHLVSIINREKENIGFIDINLNLLFDNQEPNMFVYTAGQIKEYGAEQQLDLNINHLSVDRFRNLPSRIAQWFLNTL